jgi:hypothetical protein
MDAVPLPLVAEVMVSQLALLDAVQGQPPPVVRAKKPLPPCSLIASLVLLSA